MIKIFLICILLSFPAFACDKVGADENFQYKLSEYKEDAGYFGMYQAVADLTGGKRIYIFPDKTFAIVSFCDICMGESLLAKGKFEYSKSTLTLSYDVPYKGNQKSVFYLRTGSKIYADYIAGNDSLMLDEQQLKSFSYEQNFHVVLRNLEPYPDWQTLSRKFKQTGIAKK